MSERVFGALVIGFLVGVFVRSSAAVGLSVALFALVLGIAAALLAIDVRQRSALVLMAALLCSFAGGVVRMHYASLESGVLGAHLGEQVVLEGVVFAEPDARETSTRLSLRTDSGIGVLVVAPRHAKVSYGDRVRVEGDLRLPEAFDTGLGRSFNYPAYLAKDGIQYELAFAEVERTGQGARNPIKAFAIALKQKYLAGLQSSLPEPYGGLAGGITVGDKRGSGEDLEEVFRTVGLTHIIVLSGYNIVVVMSGLAYLLARLGAPPIVRFGGSVVVALLFALMTGLASSSVRAAAMATIAAVGRVSGRVYLASRALALVAFLMVLWNPFLLAFDPGFQLSVIATLGLIAFTPAIITKLGFLPVRFGIREIAATTIATQIAVLPLLLYQSGQLPLYAFPANLLALVVMPFAMAFSALAALAGMALGPLAVFAALPAQLLLSYIIGVAEFFAALPAAMLSIPAFSAWALVPVYALVLAPVLLRPRDTLETETYERTRGEKENASET